MLVGIDHLVIAVADPDAAVVELASALGLVPGGGGQHVRLETRNRLIWLGDTYLELIGVVDPVRAASSWIGAPALHALQAGGGLATWAIATDAIDADVARLRAGGSDLATPVSGERTRPDGAVVRWRLAASSPLAPGAPPFLIEHDTAAAEWTSADRAARSADPARVSGLDLMVDDVGVARDHFARTLGLPFEATHADGETVVSTVGEQVVRLRPRTDWHAPIATIRCTIPGAESRTMDMQGCRWRVAG